MRKVFLFLHHLGTMTLKNSSEKPSPRKIDESQLDTREDFDEIEE